MRRSVFVRWILAGGCFAAVIACGDDAGGGGAGSGGAGRQAGSGAAGNAPMQDAPNPDCPIKQGPFTGEYAMKGPCCYRTSNKVRLASMAGPTGTLEYRLTSFLPTNHMKTISQPLIIGSTIDRFDREELHILLRFTLPRMNGEWVAGDGTAQIGPGRYNCDGTYSFYSETAATPANDVTDRGRWAASKVPVKFDPTKTENQTTSVWAKSTNREVTYLPYVLETGNKPLEWEAASQGFEITDMPTVQDSVDCVGKRADLSSWSPGGKVVSYQRLDLNNKSAINRLSNISLAQLQAFGAFVMDASNASQNKDTPAYNPLTAKRCQPGGDCPWRKLPDSLCPVTEAQMNQWACHVGDPMNEDKIATNCTMTPPAGVLDPDMGATSEGQCCDPLAQDTNGLPACNAYRLVSDFAAAAVKITEEPANSLQPKCEIMGGIAP